MIGLEASNQAGIAYLCACVLRVLFLENFSACSRACLLARLLVHSPPSCVLFRERVFFWEHRVLIIDQLLTSWPYLVHSQATRRQERCRRTSGRYSQGPRRRGPCQDPGTGVGHHRAGLRRRLPRLPKSRDEAGVRRRQQGRRANGLQGVPQGGPAERQCPSVDARGEWNW